MSTYHDSEGRVSSDEARARMSEVESRLASIRRELADEYEVDVAELDWIAREDGSRVVRVDGVPVAVARLSSLDADARLVIDEDDEVELTHYATEALRDMLRDFAGWVDGSPESGPRELDEDDVEWLDELRSELDRRGESSSPVCAECSGELDVDCWGDARCVECEGPCSGCYAGDGPDVDELRCSRCDRDELLYPDHPDSTSARVVCQRCDVELDDHGHPLS